MKFTPSKSYAKKNTFLLCLLSLCFSACGGSFESSSKAGEEEVIPETEFWIRPDWTSTVTEEKFAKSANIRLHLQYHKATKVHVSNNANCTGSVPYNYVPLINWQLPAGDGAKYVGVQFETSDGKKSQCFTDEIHLYTAPPNITQLDIAGKEDQIFNAVNYSYIPTSLARMTALTDSLIPVFAHFSYEDDCSETFPQNVALPMFFNIPPSQSPYKVSVRYENIFEVSTPCMALNIIVDDLAPYAPKVFPLPLMADRGTFKKDPVIQVLNKNDLEPQSLAQIGFKEFNYRILRASDGLVQKDWATITDHPTLGTLQFPTNLRTELMPQLYTIEVSAIDKLNNRSETLQIPWAIQASSFVIPSVVNAIEGTSIQASFKVEGFDGSLPLSVTSEAAVCNGSPGTCTTFAPQISVSPSNIITIRMTAPNTPNTIRTAYVNFQGRTIPWSVSTGTLCPDGFVLSPPPPNGSYLSEFCIARMEMRWNDGTPPNASGLDNNAIRAKNISVADIDSSKIPIHDISYENMTHLCGKIQRPGSSQALRGRLPSAIEWNHIADDLRKNEDNWKTPATNAELPVGNVISPVPLALDPDAPCSHYSSGSCNATTWATNNRELRLSNNFSIFDFAGNLSETVKEVFDIPSNLSAFVIDDLSSESPWDKIFPLHTHTCANQASNGCGLGKVLTNVDIDEELTVLRGGSHLSNSTEAGVYALETLLKVNDSSPQVGFRCITDVYR